MYGQRSQTLAMAAWNLKPGAIATRPDPLLSDKTALPWVAVSVRVSAVVTRSATVVPVPVIKRTSPDSDLPIHGAHGSGSAGTSAHCKPLPGLT